MRIRALFLLALLLLAPTISSALVRPALSKTRCPAGASSEAPALSSKLLTEKTPQADAEKFLNTAIYCPNACYNLKATLTLTYSGIQVDVAATDVCKYKDKLPNDPAQGTKRGCLKGEQEPSISLTTKDVYSRVYGFSIKDQTINKSRCDENALYTSVGKFFDGLQQVQTNAAAGQSQMQTALNELQSNTDPRPDGQETVGATSPASVPDPDVAKPAPVPTTDEALSQFLTDKYGVPADQAKSLVETDADKVKSMIEKSNTNDIAGAQAIAKELKLNDDVMTKIAEMTPPKQMTPDEANAIYDQQHAGRQNTFEQPAQTTTGLSSQCGVDGLAGNIMRAESSCGRINSNPLSSVQGPYHFLCDTWTAYAQSTGNGQYSNCAYRNDSRISTQVMNAKMDQFAQTYGTQCTQAGLSLSSCQYAIHVFGEGGYRQMFNAYQTRPNDSAFSLCGSALGNSACSNNSSIFRNGGTIAGVFGELDRRLGGNGTVIPTIASNASPFTGFTTSDGVYTTTGSPFGGVNPFYGSVTGYSTPTGYSTSYGYQPSVSQSTGGWSSFLSGLFGGYFNSAAQPTQNRPIQQVAYPSQTAAQQAVISIIAQPQNAYVGNKIVVSWSSVGVQTTNQCTTVVVTNSGTSTLATANEGSKIITAEAKGLMRFTITCTTLAGAVITQATNVAVQ